MRASVYFLLAFVFLPFVLSAQSRDLLILGSVEMVTLTPPGETVPARIDTGAAVSSLSAYQVEEFLRDGRMWVRFRTSFSEEQTHSWELPVKRTLLVRQGSREELQHRYIVEIQIQLGEMTLSEEFSLADRRGMAYPVLIGRNILEGKALVDVSGEFFVSPPDR